MAIGTLLLGALLFVCMFIQHTTATADDNDIGDVGRVISTVNDTRINEASGLATSRRHQDILYTHNDSGGRKGVFAIEASTGRLRAILNVVGDGVRNCDWEDIAVGPLDENSNTSYIYIGDIGGNALFQCNVLYRVQEPDILSETMDVPVDGKLKFSYGAGNAETLMVDEKGVVWLVSKVKGSMHPHLFRVAPEAWEQEGRVDLGNGSKMPVTFEVESPTGGDISVDGQWIILKGYHKVVAWQRQKDQTLEETLTESTGEVMPYVREKQGEAICWDLTADGYYTLSEGYYQSIWYYNNTMRVTPDNNAANTLCGTPVVYSVILSLLSGLIFRFYNLQQSE